MTTIDAVGGRAGAAHELIGMVPWGEVDAARTARKADEAREEAEAADEADAGHWVGALVADAKCAVQAQIEAANARSHAGLMEGAAARWRGRCLAAERAYAAQRDELRAWRWMAWLGVGLGLAAMVLLAVVVWGR